MLCTCLQFVTVRVISIRSFFSHVTQNVYPDYAQVEGEMSKRLGDCLRKIDDLAEQAQKRSASTVGERHNSWS